MGSADVKGIIYLSTNILQIYETIRAKANKDSDALIEHLLNLHVQWAQRRIGISVAETLAMRYYGIEQAMKMNSDSLMEHLISLYNGEFDEMKEEHADIEEYSQDALSNSNMADSLSSHCTSKEITYMSSSRLPVTSYPFRSSRRRIDRDQLPNKSSNVTDNSTFPSIMGNSALPSISHSKVVGGRSNKGLGHFEMSSEYTERGTERRTFEQLHYPVSIGTTFNSASQPKDSQSFQPSSDLPTRKDKYYSQCGVSSNVTDIPNNMETLPEDFVIVNIKEEMDTSNLEATGDWGEKVGRRKSTNNMQQMTAAHGCETSSFTLTDSAQFQDLLQSVHGGGKAKTYTCFICQKQFRTLSTYRYHVPTHKNQQGFTCRQCNHTFPRLSLLRFHMRSHTAMALDLSCSCADGSIHDMTITDENETHNSMTDVALSLKLSTPKGSSTPNHQTKPQNCQKKSKTDTSYVCSSCGKIFAYRQNLKRHEEGKHKGNYKHICTHCNKGFHKKRSLLEHIQSHAGIKSERCSKCGREYSSRDARRRHENQCEGKCKENVCMVCKSLFSSKRALVDHIKGKHTKQNRYSCETCCTTFSWRSSLRHHRRFCYNASSQC